jgi:hypothetical protein
LIVDEKSEFDQNVLALDNNFKTKYGQLLKHTMEANVLWFWSRMRQHPKQVDIWNHNNTQISKRDKFLSCCFCQKLFEFFFKFREKKIDGAKCSFILKT